MLQQTRVSIVRLRYGEFISRFPTIRSLADAAVDDVVAAWSGLGYYARARNMHAAAEIIMRNHGGRFPNDLAAAGALPGIGPYMSRAVLSIAHGIPVAVVDGNVIRVLSRVCMIPSRSIRVFQAEADRLLDSSAPGDANQALMELGATICTATSPACHRCPVLSLCRARRAGRVGDFPPKRRRPATVASTRTIWVAKDGAGRYWLERRTRPPLQGLWTFPWREEEAVPAAPHLGTVTHAIMNRRYRCEVRLAGDGIVPGEPAGPGRWIDLAGLASLPHSSLVTKTLRILTRQRRGARASGQMPGEGMEG